MEWRSERQTPETAICKARQASKDGRLEVEHTSFVTSLAPDLGDVECQAPPNSRPPENPPHSVVIFRPGHVGLAEMASGFLLPWCFQEADYRALDGSAIGMLYKDDLVVK